MKDQSANIDYHVWWLIIQMRRAMYKARAKELFRYGITPEEAAVLAIISTIGTEATPSEISRWSLREAHSTSELIKRMEKEGLVAKSKDLKRKNMVRVTLTEKGQEAHKQAARRESIHRIMASMSEKECQDLLTCLKKLRDAALKESGIDRAVPFRSPK